jgi:DNA-binding CsgD family transcriptional regulator
MILDRSTTPDELRALARNDINQYWAGRRRRELLPRLFKRIDQLLRGDPNTFTVLADAARPGAVCWTLTGQPANALFSERDYELYSHVAALNLKTLEETPHANKQTQFLSAAELRRYVTEMLDGCGRALSVDQLTRGLQIYYHLEPSSEEFPDENALPDHDRDTYIASVATDEDHDPPGADASAKATALLETMTPRQRTILEKLLEGGQQNEIAAELGVSQGTVSAEKDSIAQAVQQQCPDRDDPTRDARRRHRNPRGEPVSHHGQHNLSTSHKHSVPGARPASRRAADTAYGALFGEPSGPTPGEIWSLSAATPSATAQGLLLAVITTVSDQKVQVVPLSVEPDEATEWDLLIPASILGYRTIAQAKLAGTASTAQLQERLSSLPAPVMDQLTDLRDAAKHQLPIPPANLNVGPWVLSEADPRLESRRSAADQLTSYLTLTDPDPAAEWGSFGAILVRGSRAQGLSIETLTDEPWAQEIQEDKADLFNRVPPRKLARLIRGLRISWNDRVREVLANAVRATLTSSEVLPGTALGRHRGHRGRSKQSARASPEDADRAASEYVDSVQKAIDEI